jgi:FkbM family methyltransferase
MTRTPLRLDQPPRFYSQHGEDIVAWKVLADSPGPRYFVEVGMIDGLRFSNTLAFEERSWRGMCVEAHPRYVPHVRMNRPGSTVMHAAASDRSGVMPFHADPRGDLSSLQPRDEAEMKQRFGAWFEGYEVIDVPVRTLDAMLEEAGAPGGIELISIDVEGGELGVLGGLDLDRWRPRLLLIEADDDAALRALDEHLLPCGYTRARSVGINVFYTRTIMDAWRVRLARIDQRVFHTAHPTDTRIDNQIVIPCTFETRSQYARRLISTLAHAA